MNFMSMSFFKQLCVGIFLSALGGLVWGQNNTYLWPTILFVKGQDLCQFEESYGSTRMEQVNQMAGQLKDLMRSGASTPEGIDALLNLDAMTDRHRSQSVTGSLMDVTLAVGSGYEHAYLACGREDK